MSEGLSGKSTMEEVFDFCRPDEGSRVVPVTMAQREDGKSDLMIIITGKSDECQLLMANLMSYVDDMAAVAAQREADANLVGSDGAPINDDPKILVPSG